MLVVYDYIYISAAVIYDDCVEGEVEKKVWEEEVVVEGEEVVAKEG